MGSENRTNRTGEIRYLKLGNYFALFFPFFRRYKCFRVVLKCNKFIGRKILSENVFFGFKVHMEIPWQPTD